MLPDARKAENGEGKATIEAMKEDRLCQHEGADEEEDQRIGKRSERRARRSDVQDHCGGDTQKRRHGHRNGFSDPQHDYRRQDGCQVMRRRLEAGGLRPHQGEGDRREHQAAALSPQLEAFLAGAECLGDLPLHANAVC